MNKIEQVLSYLKDEQSKFIYQKRVEYNETGEYAPIIAIKDKYLPVLNKYYPGKEKKIIEKVKDKKKIVLFGDGLNGQFILDLLREHNIVVECFVDNDRNKWGIKANGVEVRSPQDIDYSEVDALVITLSERKFVDAIHEQLVELGVNQKLFVDYKDYTWHILTREQYFDPDIIKLQENEVFIDAGVLNLETSLSFIEECKKANIQNFRIHAFEPDEISYQRCQEVQTKLRNIDLHLYNVGLWSENTTLYFSESGTGRSRITKEKTETFINTVALDQCVSDKVTFIKMDVEGAELEALKGSQETIKKYKPRLAISIYHKKEDLVEIPLYIKELVPDYKFYIRHYSNYSAETVLYAVL